MLYKHSEGGVLNFIHAAEYTHDLSEEGWIVYDRQLSLDNPVYQHLVPEQATPEQALPPAYDLILTLPIIAPEVAAPCCKKEE